MGNKIRRIPPNTTEWKSGGWVSEECIRISRQNNLQKMIKMAKSDVHIQREKRRDKCRCMALSTMRLAFFIFNDMPYRYDSRTLNLNTFNLYTEIVTAWVWLNVNSACISRT